MPAGGRPEKIVKYLTSKGVYRKKGFCLGTIERGLGVDWGGSAANAARGMIVDGKMSGSIEQSGGWQVDLSDAQPGDFVIYQQGHPYTSDRHGHIGVLAERGGNILMISNLSGKIKEVDPKLFWNPDKVEVWRLP